MGIPLPTLKGCRRFGVNLNEVPSENLANMVVNNDGFFLIVSLILKIVKHYLKPFLNKIEDLSRSIPFEGYSKVWVD